MTRKNCNGHTKTNLETSRVMPGEELIDVLLWPCPPDKEECPEAHGCAACWLSWLNSNKEEGMKGGEVCGDDRFDVIAAAKADMLNATNIATSPEEMACLDTFLFRCWQMGWLGKYEVNK